MPRREKKADQFLSGFRSGSHSIRRDWSATFRNYSGFEAGTLIDAVDYYLETIIIPADVNDDGYVSMWFRGYVAGLMKQVGY